MGAGYVAHGHFASAAGGALDFTYPLTSYGDVCAFVRIGSDGTARLWLYWDASAGGTATCPSDSSTDSLRAASSVVLYPASISTGKSGWNSLPRHIDFASATTLCSAGFTLTVSGNTIACQGPTSWDKLTVTAWARGA